MLAYNMQLRVGGIRMRYKCVRKWIFTYKSSGDGQCIVRLRHIGKMRVKTGAGVTGIEPTRGLESGIRLSYISMSCTVDVIISL